MLTLEETEEWLGAVYAARFRHELTPLLADLHAEQPATSRLAQVRSWLHGIWAAAAVLAATVAGWAGRHKVAVVLPGALAVAYATGVVVQPRAAKTPTRGSTGQPSLLEVLHSPRAVGKRPVEGHTVELPTWVLVQAAHPGVTDPLPAHGVSQSLKCQVKP